MKVAVFEHHSYQSVLRVGSHHIADELRRRGHEIVWVSHPRSWVSRIRRPTPPRNFVHSDGVLEIVARPTLPFVDLPLVRTKFWGERWLDTDPRLQETLEPALRADLVWLSDFTMLPVLDRVTSALVVVRCFDRIDRFRWMPSSVYELLRAHTDRVDLCVASSRQVQRDLADRGIHAHYLPNGAPVRPPESSSVEREKLIVYVGALDSWFDLRTVEFWAREMNDVMFEIHGPNPPRQLGSELANLSFPGPLSYKRVHRVVSRARFGLIPFLVNELTLGVHPLKMYEYLEAGCPVLSADLPEVPREIYGIFKYRDPVEGLEILRTFLEEPFDREALQGYPRQNRWSDRLDEVSRVLGAEI